MEKQHLQRKDKKKKPQVAAQQAPGEIRGRQGVLAKELHFWKPDNRVSWVQTLREEVETAEKEVKNKLKVGCKKHILDKVILEDTIEV